MSFNVIPIEKFKKEAKRLIKKYPSLRQELIDLNKNLISNPAMGTSLGNNTFKIRIGIKSKGAGKIGGGRVITYLVTDANEVYLLTIYDKAELETVNDQTLKRIINSIFSQQ